MGKELPLPIPDDTHFDTPLGDAPAYLDTIPGVIHVDKAASPHHLDTKAEVFTENSPDILEHARKKGKDVVMGTTAHGTAVWVGAGVAAAAIFTGVTIYRHRHRRKK